MDSEIICEFPFFAADCNQLSNSHYVAGLRRWRRSGDDDEDEDV